MISRRLLFGLLLTLAASSGLGALYWALLIRPGYVSLPLEWHGHQLELLTPRWLGLLCGVPLLVWVRSISLVDMSRVQQLLSLALRILTIAVLALALSRPTLNTTDTKVATVFLVDVSDSVSDDQLAYAQKQLEAAWVRRGANQMRLVTFAERPLLVPLDPKQSAFPKLSRHRRKADGRHTDVQGAIQHAYGLIPPDHLPRIVLFSDGNENRGETLAESYRAGGRGVRIHVYPYPQRAQQEVMVTALSLPEDVRIGAPFHLQAEIYSTHPDKVALTLYKDELLNGLDGYKRVALNPGRNVVTFKSLVREAGFINYRLAMRGAAHDTWRHNNGASALLPVYGKPKVLYVEGEPLHGAHFKQALQSEGMDVTLRGPYGVPQSAAQLAKFDLLVLSDVPAMFVGLGQMAAIESYVRDLGGGFIMTGGENSFGAGGYYGTRIEKILPLRFDTEKKRSQPSLALALCIDRSGSMSGQKLELAKDAAKATAELLGSSDLIGVFAFDTSTQIVVRLQRAANRIRILSDISRLQAGGGTSIRPCLSEAYNQLQTASAKVKHVILLSDGQSSYGGIAQLVDEMVSRRITVSAVGVGSGADRTLLQMIAERGNGRFYHTNDASNIPKIFTKETTKVARSALVEAAVRVHVAKHANVIKGVPIASAPALRGYVSTKAKPLSEVILLSDSGEPIYAQWRLGLGKTAAFTSDVKSRWSADWQRWSGYRQFWAQVVRELMRHRIQRAFELRARAEQGVVQLSVDAVDRHDRFINGLDSEVSVMDPRFPQQKQRVMLRQTAAGRYEASFELSRYGSLLLQARHRLNGKLIAESIAALSVPYPSEYTHLLVDEAKLRQIATVTGGQLRPDAARAFASEGEVLRFNKDLWSYLLYLALGLFLLDVLLRRVRIFGWAPSGPR